MKSLTLLLIVAAVLTACEPIECCNPGPEPFLTVVYTQDGSHYLQVNGEDSVAFYYIENGKKVPLERYISKYDNSDVLLEVINVVPKSLKGINDFYLQVGEDVDTLHVVLGSKKNGWRQVESVSYNGLPGKKVTPKLAAARWELTKP